MGKTNDVATGIDLIYVATNKVGETVYRCKECPDWCADADWTVLDVAIQRASDHVKENHG